MDHENISAKNTLNELTGTQWVYFTKSIHATAYTSGYGHALRKAHGANKPPQLMSSLIEFFTKSGQRVLDPFAGVGGTLIGASICKQPRSALGIEINQKWIDIYQQVIAESNGEIAAQPLIRGDCLQVMQQLEPASFDFVVTDPPYNIHLTKTMSKVQRPGLYANRRTDYDMRSDDPADLANLQSYEEYLSSMERVFTACYNILKPQKYMVIIIRDAYQHGEYIFTHVDLARRARLHGFIPKGEIIWYQAGTRLRPYGYPFAYIPNIAHQYIVVLQKPRTTKT
ncbi:MAG: DNA methyltransferase [Ktedonobacteraceae bacterium]